MWKTERPPSEAEWKCALGFVFVFGSPKCCFVVSHNGQGSPVYSDKCVTICQNVCKA